MHQDNSVLAPSLRAALGYFYQRNQIISYLTVRLEVTLHGSMPYIISSSPPPGTTNLPLPCLVTLPIMEGCADYTPALCGLI
ncbi:hypothetical protein SETIT_9G459600v2 [Setaria italica]|uniref:Uncharacterized protein n=1 Tax=Setaria italica TaxID=4555 RepID=A0A368SUW5_SETIT|nr:hypothetical protein SETIT_9G459600v2 [Setaria italica]